MCPLGALLPTDAPHKLYQAGAEDNKSLSMHATHVISFVQQGAPILSIDDDAFPEPFEGQTKENSELYLEIPNLLDVNQLLESVCQLCHSFLLCLTAQGSHSLLKNFSFENISYFITLVT